MEDGFLLALLKETFAVPVRVLEDARGFLDGVMDSGGGGRNREGSAYPAAPAQATPGEALAVWGEGHEPVRATGLLLRAAMAVTPTACSLL